MTYWITGTIYLLHFDQPLKHAQHYLGIAEDVEARLEAHRNGAGARILEVLIGEGITWTLARTWPNSTRAQERKKKGRGLKTLCPICKALAKKEAQP